MNRVKKLTNWYHHSFTSWLITRISKFSEMLCLNLQMRYCLIKYAQQLVYIFRTEIWTLDEAKFKILSFCWRIKKVLKELKVFTEGFWISLFITPYIRKYCQQLKKKKKNFRNKMLYKIRKLIPLYKNHQYIGIKQKSVVYMKWRFQTHDKKTLSMYCYFKSTGATRLSAIN